LQSGIAGPPKWEPRSRLGIYDGHSPSHAGLVALVLNPRTGHISPQFCVAFDDLFTTVPYMKKSEVPPNWAELVEKSSERVTDEDYDLAKTWFFPDTDNGDIAMQETNNSRTLAGNSGNLIQTMLPSGHQIDFSRSNNLTGISQEDSIPLFGFSHRLFAAIARQSIGISSHQLRDFRLAAIITNCCTQ
jgi:hypothetical protein